MKLDLDIRNFYNKKTQITKKFFCKKWWTKYFSTSNMESKSQSEKLFFNYGRPLIYTW